MHSNGNDYTVKGMHCSHCSTSIAESVGRIDGVDDVDIDLATGSLTFISDKPVDPETVSAAVEEAGYELAGR